MKDIIEIVKSLEDSGLLFKEINKAIENEAKEQKGGFLRHTKRLLGNNLAGKGINWVGEGTIRTGYGNKRQDHRNKMDF